MNIETANRLYELRKQNGLSQEEVADKLGISRQAVSKWERAEASPDTDNLISLAKLYGVSLDELLNTNKSFEFVEENGNPEEIIEDDKNLEVMDLENEEENADTKEEKYVEENNKKHSTLKAVIDGIVLFGAAIAYLLLGFFTPLGFQTYWVLFLLLPLVSSLFDAINCKRMRLFVYPLLVVFIYCFLGMRFQDYTYTIFGQEFTGFWHPLWVLFITIPVYYVIASAVDSKLKEKYN